MYRLVPEKVEVATIFGDNRYLAPFNRGIATPVCELVRNDSKNSTNTNFSVCAGKPYEFEKISDNGLHPITYNYIIQGKAGIAYQKRSRRFRFRSPRSRSAGEVFAFLIAEMIFSKAFVPGILV